VLFWKYSEKDNGIKIFGGKEGLNKDKITIFSESEADTLSIGEIIGKQSVRGDVLALSGELGAGKTCLTKGIAQGLELPPCYTIASPTFTIINEYPCKLILYHIDVFRLTGDTNVDGMDYEEYFSSGGVVVVEWAEKIADLLPRNTISIYLSYGHDEKRRIEIMGEEYRIAKIANAMRKGEFYI
jgi:tRNA threonylcarbamoyladenosine biosynthesis protein TsaE